MTCQGGGNRIHRHRTVQKCLQAIALKALGQSALHVEREPWILLESYRRTRASWRWKMRWLSAQRLPFPTVKDHHWRPCFSSWLPSTTNQPCTWDSEARRTSKDDWTTNQTTWARKVEQVLRRMWPERMGIHPLCSHQRWCSWPSCTKINWQTSSETLHKMEGI